MELAERGLDSSMTDVRDGFLVKPLPGVDPPLECYLRGDELAIWDPERRQHVMLPAFCTTEQLRAGLRNLGRLKE